MPIYNYECTACGHRIERFHYLTPEERFDIEKIAGGKTILKEGCPNCRGNAGSEMVKVPSVPGKPVIK